MKYEAADGTERGVKFGIKGQCDSFWISNGGGHGEVEFKAAGGRLNPAQQAWRDWCREHEVPWICLLANHKESETVTVQRWVHEVAILLRDLRAAAGNSQPLTSESMARFERRMADTLPDIYLSTARKQKPR